MRERNNKKHATKAINTIDVSQRSSDLLISSDILFGSFDIIKSWRHKSANYIKKVLLKESDYKKICIFEDVEPNASFYYDKRKI